MNKYLLYVFLLLICLVPLNVKADCSDAEIQRLNKLSSNVSVEHEYSKELINDGYLTMPKTTSDGSFYIFNPDDAEKYKSVDGSLTAIISGINDELTITDGNSGYNYTSEDIENNGIIINNVSFENRVYYVYSRECGFLLRTISFENFNPYYDDDFCQNEENSNLSICQMFTNSVGSDESFKDKVEQYNEKKVTEEKKDNVFDNVKLFLINYYLFLLIGIALIIILVIFIKVRKRRSVLE